MLSDGKFKEFIKTVIPSNPNVKNPVDVYGDFEIRFQKAGASFSNVTKLYDIFAVCGIPGISGEDFYNKDFHGYIKNIGDLQLNTMDKNMDLPGISYSLQRLMPMNPSPNFTISWLSTAIPYIERIFVPWMIKNTIENSFPLLKTDLQITFPMLSNYSGNIEFWYYGVRPVECDLHKMTNEPLTDFYRKVKFDFDYFYVYPYGKGNKPPTYAEIQAKAAEEERERAEAEKQAQEQEAADSLGREFGLW